MIRAYPCEAHLEKYKSNRLVPSIPKVSISTYECEPNKHFSWTPDLYIMKLSRNNYLNIDKNRYNSKLMSKSFPLARKL